MGKIREYIKKCIRQEVQLTIATLIKIRQKDWKDYFDALFHEERKKLEEKIRQNLKTKMEEANEQNQK